MVDDILLCIYIQIQFNSFLRYDIIVKNVIYGVNFESNLRPRLQADRRKTWDSSLSLQDLDFIFYKYFTIFAVLTVFLKT